MSATAPKVSSAWLFGSQASGRARPDSDVDIGLLVSQRLTTEELLDLQVQLMRATHNDRIDLSLLNDASSILCFEVISGRNVVCRDPALQAVFFSAICRDYERAQAMIERGFRHRRGSFETHSDVPRVDNGTTSTPTRTT